MLAIKDSIVFKQLPFLDDLEIVSVEIEATFVLCLIYYPPNCADQYNYSLLLHLNSLDYSKKSIITGDLNKLT